MRITWIGFGAMGLPMATRLAQAGHTVRGRASSPAKHAALEAAGIEVVDDLRASAGECDLVVSIVPGPHEVLELWTGDNGLFAAMRPGAVAIDMSTVGAETAVKLHAAGAEKSVVVVDSPVSGGVVGAANGALTLFVGGDVSTVTTLTPMLSTLGTVIPCGDAGSGQQAKLVNQVIVALNTYGLCLAYALTERSGIDRDLMFSALTGGAADGRLLRLEWPLLQANDLRTGFAVAHMVKDIGLLTPLLRAADLDSSVVEAIEARFRLTAEALGDGVATQALAQQLEHLPAAKPNRTDAP